MKSLGKWMCATALCAAITLPVVAQMAAGGPMSGFRPNSDFIFDLGGETLKDATIYHSERAVAYLIMAPELASPLLINPRSRTVESIHLMKVSKKDDGSIDLLNGATLAIVGNFQIDGREVVFNFDGKEGRMKPKPWLLGMQAGQEMIAHSPSYGERADAYSPRGQSVDALRQHGSEATVRVYFGSWCPACQRLVPKVLRIDRDIEGSKINFEYYGLPSPLTDDPEAARMKIRGVPTGVIFVDGKEVGRLQQDDWTTPEVSIARILKDQS